MTEHTQHTEGATSGAERDWIIIRAEAKRLYETTGASFASVASDLNVSERAVKRWSAQDDGWRKENAPASTAERVLALAAIAAEMEQTPAPVVGTGDPTTEPTREEIEAKLLLRHRQQWAAVSNLSVQAARNRDEQSARLAHALSRTFAVMQRSERIAYGLGTGETPPATVVLERE